MQKLAIAVVLLTIAIYILVVSGVGSRDVRIATILITVAALWFLIWAYASRGGGNKKK